MKIAIIGSGVSGLSLAYILNKNHDITVFEKNDYIGGHARTIDVSYQNEQASIDTGFIVFNKKNYPLLTGLFDHLDVDYEKSDMSFSVSMNNGKFEYGTKTLNSLFSQRKNILNPKFWIMVRDILKFYNKAMIFSDQLEKNVDDLINHLKLSKVFKEFFLLPIASSIWSAKPQSILNFPASTLVNFFDNHGLLTVNNQPDWYTVSGGSKKYIKVLTSTFEDKIKKSSTITKLERVDGKVHLFDKDLKKYEFDQVVFACHSDQALNILHDATPDEIRILENIKYHSNNITLHCDESIMPQNKRCWSSWNFSQVKHNDSLVLTYWMNKLQNLKTSTDFFVTVNADNNIDDSKILDQYVFEHPIFDLNTMKSQRELDLIQGKNNTWFAGAYWGYGFHEDGILSAVNISDQMGEELPWQLK